MKLLIDTHLLIWAADQVERLPAQARALMGDPANDLAFSAASIWEIAIKRGMKRADFDVDPQLLRRGLLDAGYTEIPVSSDHAVEVELMPPLHKDPFDRLLIAQAAVEGMLLLTNDAVLGRCPGPVKVV